MWREASGGKGEKAEREGERGGDEEFVKWTRERESRGGVGARARVYSTLAGDVSAHGEFFWICERKKERRIEEGRRLRCACAPAEGSMAQFGFIAVLST